MANQIERIIEASRLPNVTFGVLPVDVIVTHVAPAHNFHIYDRHTVIFGTETGTALLSDSSRVSHYEARFAEVEKLAAFGDNARSLLTRIADRYRERAGPPGE